MLAWKELHGLAMAVRRPPPHGHVKADVEEPVWLLAGGGLEYSGSGLGARRPARLTVDLPEGLPSIDSHGSANKALLQQPVQCTRESGGESSVQPLRFLTQIFIQRELLCDVGGRRSKTDARSV